MSTRTRLRAGTLVALAALTAGLGSAGAAHAADLYPDLKMRAPSSLRLVQRTVNAEPHHLITFSTRVWNMGQGALELDRIPDTSGLAEVVQRIYQSPVGFRDEPIGASIFGAGDFTFPVPDIARYELWTAREYRRAAQRDFARGQPLFSRPPLSYCVADVEQIDPNAQPAPTYVQCAKTIMGITVGWADITTGTDEPLMSIDVGTTPLPDGDYVLRGIADPENHLFESEGKADPARESEVANQGVSYFRLVNGQMAGVE